MLVTVDCLFTHYLVVSLTDKSNQKIQQYNKVDDLIYQPENPNECNHAPCKRRMDCGFIKPIIINWCLYISYSISVCIYKICYNEINVNIIIFIDLNSKNLKENAEQNDETEEKYHKWNDIVKALANQFNLFTETFENS